MRATRCHRGCRALVVNPVELWPTYPRRTALCVCPDRLSTLLHPRRICLQSGLRSVISVSRCHDGVDCATPQGHSGQLPGQGCICCLLHCSPPSRRKRVRFPVLARQWNDRSEHTARPGRIKRSCSSARARLGRAADRRLFGRSGAWSTSIERSVQARFTSMTIDASVGFSPLD